MCHNELKSLAPRRAAKIAAAAASVNFGWRGGAPNFFRRRRRGRVSAGCGGGIRRLRGLRVMVMVPNGLKVAYRHYRYY